MFQVTTENLDEAGRTYSTARGSTLNDRTDSEAMFICFSKYGGIYQLLAYDGNIMWVGVQNASSRWTEGGLPFRSVESALRAVLVNPQIELWYTDNSVERLRFVADTIEKFKALNETRLVVG